MKMLTGDVAPSGGRASILGADCTNDAATVRGHIGYCPQHDPLFDLLTPRETLWLYARLKGFSARQCTDVVNALVQAVDLTEAADRMAGALSGGNKRKLCVAVALVGLPSVLFLDEPSSGMDPISQRRLWSTLQAITAGPSVAPPLIILTSHSMQECAALCQSVGIMIHGRLACLGSIPHLQARFGAALQVEVRVAPPTPADLLTALSAVHTVGAWDSVQHATPVPILHSILQRLPTTLDIAALATAMAADPTVRSVLHDSAALAAAVATWLRVAAVSHHIQKTVFPGATEVVESHGVKLRFAVSPPTGTACIPLSAAFEAIASHSDSGGYGDGDVHHQPGVAGADFQ